MRWLEDTTPCDACSLPTPLHLLDGKPPPDKPQAADWTRLECPACYGPGYSPGGEATWPDAIKLAASRGVTLVEPPRPTESEGVCP